MAITNQQVLKIMSYDWVQDVEILDKDRFFIHLSPSYSWHKKAFVHTRAFNTFEEAEKDLEKFK